MMSTVRSYLPESVNENVMYGVGALRCFVQPYVNTEFNANALVTEPRILVGDLASASNRDAMHDQGITHVLCVLNGGMEQFPGEFEYMIVHANDDPWVDIGIYFDEGIQFIDSALISSNEAKILVHCQRGASRSVTLVAAYLLYNMNRAEQITEENVAATVNGVIATIHNVRDIASPNEGFIASLNRYVCRLNGYDFPQIEEEETVEVDETVESSSADEVEEDIVVEDDVDDEIVVEEDEEEDDEPEVETEEEPETETAAADEAPVDSPADVDEDATEEVVEAEPITE
jgi:dual specificity protein phosphatase-like protein